MTEILQALQDVLLPVSRQQQQIQELQLDTENYEVSVDQIKTQKFGNDTFGTSTVILVS